MDLGALEAPFFLLIFEKVDFFALNDLLSLIITSIIPYMMNERNNDNRNATASRLSDNQVGRLAFRIFAELKRQGLTDKEADRQSQLEAKKAFVFGRIG